MGAKEMAKLIGTVVLIRDGECKYEAKVVDAKESYGKLRLLVEPVAGCGQRWVQDWCGKGY